MKKVYLIIAGCMMAIAGVVLFLVLPGYDSLNSDRTTISDRQMQLNSLNKFSENLRTLTQKYNIDPGQFDVFLAALPQQEDLPKLLKNLESLAAGNNLIMNSVEFKEADQKIAQPKVTNEISDTGNGATPAPVVPSTTAPPYKTAAIRLSLSGTYSSLKNYLQAVEGNDRLMDITSVSYSSAEPVDGQGNNLPSSIFSIKLNVYHR